MFNDYETHNADVTWIHRNDSYCTEAITKDTVNGSENATQDEQLQSRYRRRYTNLSEAAKKAKIAKIMEAHSQRRLSETCMLPGAYFMNALVPSYFVFISIHAKIFL